VRAAFDTDPHLNRVRATTDPRNIGSLRVMDKLRMTREGVLRQNRLFRGELTDEAWCGVLRSEFTVDD
jgi:RimJ/RimL family protein N-acetyltransferase